MLSEKDIRSTIVQRIVVMNASCSSSHRTACVGQIRALAYVLGDGSQPFSPYASVTEICESVGIPTITNNDKTVSFPYDWLKEHGFEVNGDNISHSRLGIGW